MILSRLPDLLGLIRLIEPSVRKQSAGIAGTVALSALASVLFVVGYVVVIAGLYAWLTTHFPPDQVLLITGGVILASGTLLALCAYMISRSVSRVEPGPNVVETISRNGHELFDSLIKELDEPIKENPMMAVTLAAFAGYVAAERTL